MKKGYIIMLALCLVALAGCSGLHKSEETKAKYIFLFIGDGMGQGNVALTESYLSHKDGKLGGTGNLIFTTFPYTGAATTFSANKSITCSSASGTAIATGEKTDNKRLGLDPEGNILKSMAYDLKEDGYNIGIMSNVAINHATPASFYAHAEKRYDYYDISRQIAESGFEFFAGDGFIDFNGKDGDQEDIDLYLEKNGVSVCYGESEYEQNKEAERILLCQPSNRKENSIDYVVEQTSDEDLTLAEMLEKAIEKFEADGKPFFIMAEGGTIDWAAHINRAKAMTEKILELDEAVREAYEFYEKHPEETLIIVTADHETGGAVIAGRKNREMIDWDLVDSVWTASGNKDTLDEKQNAELNERANIGWTTFGHAGGPVPVFAIGKGAERFTGWYDNTDIKGKILAE